MRAIATLGLLLLCAASAAGEGPGKYAASSARAVRLLDGARTATGGRAWERLHTIRYRATVSAGDRSGSAETVEDARSGRYADRYVVGDVKGGQGFDGERSWTLDVTGTTVSGGGAEDARADANEIYRRSLSYWFRDRHAASLRDLGRRSEGDLRFEVVEIVPLGGRPFELWLDAASHRIARLVESGPAGRRTTEFSDYRNVGALSFPFMARSRSGAEGATLVRFTSIEINPRLPSGAFSP